MVTVLVATWSRRRHFKVDRQILSRLSGEFAQKHRRRFEAEIYELAGEPNSIIGSPKQLGDILFGKFGLSGGKKTKTGAWSTGASVLEELAAEGNHASPRKHSRLAPAVEAQVDLHRSPCPTTSTPTPATRAHLLSRSPRPPPGACRRRNPTCRISRSARTEAGRKHPHRLHRRQGDEADLRRLFSQIELRLLAHMSPTYRQLTPGLRGRTSTSMR